MADPLFKDLAFSALAQTARNPTGDFLQATPRNPILGYLSDLAASSYSPERTQQMQGVAQFMGAPAISETLNRLSYGEPLTTGAGGLGGTTRVRPEALEAAMTLTPMVAPTARMAGAGAMAVGRAGERFAERAVPLVMERGGMGAEMLQGMSRGTVSPMGELTVTGRRPTQVDPNALVFREKVQNRKADLKADTDEFDPIVVIDDSGKLSILDGHNRAAVAKDRGDSLAAVKINQAEYDALQAQGFEDGEIAWAALQRANQSYAAGNLNSQFPGADIARGGDKAWDALIDFKDSPKGMVEETYAGFATPEQYNAAKFYGQNQTERWPAAWQRAGAVTPEEILRGKGIVQPPPTQRDKDLYLLESRFSGYMNASKARQFLENDMLKATKKEKDLLRKYYDASGKFIAREEVPVQQAMQEFEQGLANFMATK